MANILKLKRRLADGTSPAALKSGEVAFNEFNKILYYGAGDDGGGNATSIISIAGEGAAMLLALSQTITGDKTFTGTVDMDAATSVLVPTVSAADDSTKAASTAFVKDQNYLTGNQTITVTGDVGGSGTTAITLTLDNVVTAGTNTKLTYDAKGRVTAGTTLAASDIPTITAAKISDFDTEVQTNRLDQMAAPTGNVSMNSFRLTNLADPSSAQDAATQAYVLEQVASILTGQDWKPSVRVATTANITLSATQTIDGIAVIVGDRVLVKDQSAGSANGIYVVAAGAWTRATDMDTSAEASPGSTVVVDEGAANGDTIWLLTTNGGITLGTTALTFTQLPGSTAYSGTANRITVNGHTIDIAANYAGQNTITTLGTVTAGALGTGFTTVAVPQGGTGVATFATGYVKSPGTTGALTSSATIPTTDLTGILPDARMPNLTGDVTTSEGAVATTITNGAVTLGKMANLGANTIIGNNTGGSTTPLALTPTQVKSLLAVAQADVAGLTTASSPTFAGVTLGTTPLAAGSGGTGNAHTAFTGPSSTVKTFTLPNANATILTTNATVTVAQGGTGVATLTGIAKGNGTGAFTAAVAGTDYLSPNSTIDGGTY